MMTTQKRSKILAYLSPFSFDTVLEIRLGKLGIWVNVELANSANPLDLMDLVSGMYFQWVFFNIYSKYLFTYCPHAQFFIITL